MSCSFQEKISLLVDGELSPEEAALTQAHLSGCRDCRKAQEDFLLLRKQIAAYEYEPDLIAERQSLQDVLASRPESLWQRRISLPVPAFALIALAVLALIVWAALAHAVGTQPIETANETGRAIESIPAPSQETPDDLSRFDQGKRAAIFKVGREQSDSMTQ